jgi:signal transduction histidine kinase
MHLEAALRNVIDNAVKYSFRGTEQRPREIVVQGRLLRGGYEIMVENYGVGIDEDELESIFEPGYQSRHKAKERVTGFGMGLAIVRQYVQMHGGRVWATSSPQTDSATITVTTPYLTRLWIRLPKRPPATPNPPEEKSR